MSHNAANAESVEESEKKIKRERDQELEDIKHILSTAHGVRFFRRFLEEGSVFSSTFTGNSQTFFLEGKRSFALKYFSDICEASPEKVAEIMIKAKE